MALRLTRALLTAVPRTSPNLTTQNNWKRPPTAILEVERKFRRLTLPTLTAIPFHNNTTTTTHLSKPEYTRRAFQSILPLPTRQIHDIYYDPPRRTLGAAGAWIRKRNGAWEAKVRRGGDFVNSRFEELKGARAVWACVERIIPERDSGGVGVAAGEERLDFGLERVAKFVTTREAWVVDGEFTVVRDRMDFGHEVGEVELQVEWVEGGEGLAGKEVAMEEMDRRIEGFMKRYWWAWEEGEAVGKLTAYFEMVEAGESEVKR